MSYASVCNPGEFFCKTAETYECVYWHQVCDRVHNCRDGSDEADCGYGDCIQDFSWCRNGGTCDYSQGRCFCPPGFAGERCETGVKYMLNECSKYLYLNATDTLVLKSQSSNQVPTDVFCEVYLKAPSSRHQILVHIVKFSMHYEYDCKSNYLQFNYGEKICSRYNSQYVLPDDTSMKLKLGFHSEHYGFIMTISTFVNQQDYYGYYGCHWPYSFTCDNRRCVSRDVYSNGFDDCGDGSDEQDFTCYSNEFKCSDRCIPSRWKCDCNYDCIDGEDEWRCDCPNNQGATCAPNEIWCEHTQTCIYYGRTCSKDIQTTLTNNECRGKKFLCEDSYKCIPMDFVCDNYIDCDDESDENNCRVSSGVLTGIVLASMLSVVCFVGASLLVVSIVLKRRQERERCNNDIRTVSAYVPPEPQNLYTNCDIPPSYEIAVGIDKEALEDKESVSPESKSNSDFEEGEDPSVYDLPDFDDCLELPLMNAISEIAKTKPPHL